MARQYPISLLCLATLSTTCGQVSSPSKPAVYLGLDLLMAGQSLEYIEYSSEGEKDGEPTTITSSRTKQTVKLWRTVEAKKLGCDHVISLFRRVGIPLSKKNFDDTKSDNVTATMCATSTGIFRIRLARGGETISDKRIPILPTEARIGDMWNTETESCYVHKTPFCTAGMQLECTSQNGLITQVTNTHYCSKSGFVGYDTLAVNSKTSEVIGEAWSGPVLNDGIEAPFIAREERRQPDRVKKIVEKSFVPAK